MMLLWHGRLRCLTCPKPCLLIEKGQQVEKPRLH